MLKRILLAHLDPEVEVDLRKALSHLSVEIEFEPAQAYPESFIDWRSYDVVFCPPELAEVRSILAASSGAPPKPAVIAASRIPEEKEWVNVLEAGAKDYCASPFEDLQIERMLAACA
jgi:DNA-binding response OmpR family regulator